MGKKKGGKKGKKGGKKGKKGGKKSKEPQMTAKEAILAYQINVVEKKLEDVMYETRGWEEKNKRHLDRNNRLKEEQEVLIRNLLRQSKDADKLFDGESVIEKSHVTQAMKDKWEKQREREKRIEELKRQIALAEVEITSLKKEVDYWTLYKNKGQHEHSTQIKTLEGEIEDMTNSFDEMKGHLDRSLEKTRNEIQIYTDQTLDQQKHKASEKAINQMDKYSRQEVLDNDWLKREVLMHRRDTQDLTAEVEDLERQNLEIMAELFECKIEDLKISRQFYLTQFGEGENLDESGILEMDLAQLSIEQPPATEDLEIKSVRPKSATHRAVEDKVFSLVTASLQSDEESDASSEDTEMLDNVYFEEEDWADYLHLGPLELKLLNVTGQSMPIHVPEPPSEEEQGAKTCAPDQWPVTQPMLKELVTPRQLAT